MKIFITSAEAHLQNLLDSIQTTPAGWRCIHFPIHRASEEGKQSFNHKLCAYGLKEPLSHYDGSVFILGNGDLYILFQGASHKIIKALQDNIISFLPAAVLQSLNHTEEFGCFSLHDLSQNMDEFLRTHPLDFSMSLPPEQTALHDISQFRFNRELLGKKIHERATRTRAKIMVVEDDHFTRHLITSSLRDHFEIIESDTGFKALSLYQHHAPDVVFLDINLPDISGHQILQHIRETDAKAVIIMLSGNKFAKDVDLAIKCGARGFVGKPFTKQKLFGYLSTTGSANNT